MSSITALLADDSDWCVLGEVQTLDDGAKVTKIWCCNFGSSAKVFTVDLPSIGTPFTKNVAAGTRGYLLGGGVDFNAPNLKFRMVSPSDPYWDLRLFDGDTLVRGATNFSAV